MYAIEQQIGPPYVDIIPGSILLLKNKIPTKYMISESFCNLEVKLVQILLPTMLNIPFCLLTKHN